MKWYTIALPLALLLLFFAIYLQPTNELFVDLGEHLLKGQIVIQTHAIPNTNIFSYTYPTYNTINLEWLTETLFYIVYMLFGSNGLLLLLTGISLISVTALYLFAVRRSNLILVSAISLLYLLGIYERARILPEMFSYLFITIIIIILYKNRERYTKLLWLLPLIQLLWVNMHIYFIIGIVLMGLFLLEGIIHFRKRENGRYVKTLILVFATSCILTLVNPYGIHGALFPFTFGHNYGISVLENGSILRNDIAQAGAIDVSIVLYSLLAIFWSFGNIVLFKRNRLIDILIAIIFIPLPLFFRRTVSIVFFVSFIPFINVFYTLYIQNKKRDFFTFMANYQSGFATSIILLTSTLILWVVLQLGAPSLGTTHKYENAIDFFTGNSLKGPIFNNYDIGSYLAYRLYPHEKVFIDSRPEAYPSQFLQKTYLPMLSDEPTFQAANDTYHFNTIIYGYNNGTPLDMGFISYLLHSNEWKLVYLDDSVLIFAKNTPQNNYLIQRYALSDDNFRLPKHQSFPSFFNLARFLSLIEWKKSELAVTQKLYSMDPSNCMVLRNLIILEGEKSFDTTTHIAKYQQMRCTDH